MFVIIEFKNIGRIDSTIILNDYKNSVLIKNAHLC